MAIVWVKQTDDCLYEVRSAGATHRLYTNKVFHSQFNPNKKIQGGIWDLLSFPIFAFEVGKIQRVLVLGVGGGTVLHQIQKLFSPKQILGIELNPIHIFIAKKFFKLNHKSIKLIEADAINWLQTYKGEKFDIIIDDLFGHHDGEAERVISVNKQWSARLLSQLNEDGMLIVNFGSNKELKNSACVSYKNIAKQFASILRLSLAQYENAIGVFSINKINCIEMRNNFDERLGLNSEIKRSSFKYRVKQIK
jgi:spermidine synthase